MNVNNSPQTGFGTISRLPDKKTIYLVNPLSGSNVAGLTECIDLLGYGYLCANLSLPTLAAMVDQRLFNVVICDENVDTIDFDFPCDIVGLTIYHYQPQTREDGHRRGTVRDTEFPRRASAF